MEEMSLTKAELLIAAAAAARWPPGTRAEAWGYGPDGPMSFHFKQGWEQFIASIPEGCG
jgi:hypothetical protein